MFEKDVLFAKIPEPDVRAFQGAFADTLSSEEKETINEYIKAMRKKSPFFAFRPGSVLPVLMMRIMPD